MTENTLKPLSRLTVCAYFVPEVIAALALEGRGDVEIIPFRGRCDERPVAGHCPLPADHETPLLCGDCAGKQYDPILSFDWCFELLLGPSKLSFLLSEGCHLMTPCMLDAWPENVEAWGFSPDMARDYFGESVSRFIVLDAGVCTVDQKSVDTVAEYTGRPVEQLPVTLDYLRLMLRHVFEFDTWRTEIRNLRVKLNRTQGLKSDLAMAYDLLARIPPFPGESAAVNGLLQLFDALFAPRAVHYIPVLDKHSGVVHSLPDIVKPCDDLLSRNWAEAENYGYLGDDGFHILVHRNNERLGRVLVEGLAFPERRDDYLDLANFVTPVLALFIRNGQIHEHLRAAEAVRREKNVLRAILDAVPVWIAYLDRNGRIVLDNKQQGALFGSTITDSENAFREDSAPLLWDEHGALLKRCLNGETVPFSGELAGKDSKKSYISGMYVPVKQQDGEVEGVIVAVSDISEPMRKEREQREQEAIYHAIFDCSRDGILIADTSDQHVHHSNPAICNMLGYSRNELNAMVYKNIYPPISWPRANTVFERSLYGEPVGLTELLVRRKAGSDFPAEISVTPINLNDQTYLLSIFRDITERKEAESKLRLNAAVFNNALEGITITDRDGNIVDVNEGFTYITGYSLDEVLGKNPSILQSGKHNPDFYVDMWQELTVHGHWAGEIWNRRKNGDVYAEWLTITTVRDEHDEVVNYIGVFSDITFAKQHEHELERIAHYDALTGIPNRLLLADRMKQVIAKAKRDREMVAVCYLDLDGFKPVNDTMGHQAGDYVLIEIVRRIGSVLREGDTVARLGGDEFVVLLPGLRQVEECVNTLKRLQTVIAEPVVVQGRSFILTASIGVSIYPDDDSDPDALLRYSDQAMYSAKQSGKNRFHLFDASFDRKSRLYQEAMQRIRTALECNEFELYYQPKIELSTRKVVSAEALIRWNHPERGLLLPGEFLTDIRDPELEIRLGEWVISKAAEQLAAWNRAGIAIDVSVNVSLGHLQAKGFADFLNRILSERAGDAFGHLSIEILETTALEEFAHVSSIMETCRTMGARFSLDDFGTGYSSLTYLHRLPVDTLKIDQSFVRELLAEKGDNAIVQGVIALAKAFGLKTVAEGIETEEHMPTLLKMGCEYGQGFAIAHPMPANTFIDWMNDYRC